MLKLKKYPTRSPFWIVRGTVAGVRIFESTGTTDRWQADEYRRKKEKETYDAIALGKQPPCTFSEAVTVYTEDGGQKRFLLPLLDYFADKPLADIGQAEITKAAKALYPNAKPSTINRQVITPFICVARAAVKAELPGAVLRPIKRRKVQKPTVTPATDEHIEKLLPYCSEGLAALIVLMTYTGLRTGEALRVTNDDCFDGFVHVADTKNGEPRMAPIPHGFRIPDGGFGFETTQGVGKALRRAHKKAGLPYRDGHELGRHTFAARWLASGGSIKSLKEAGGWKKLAVVDDNYGHLERTAVHKKMRDLSKNRAKNVQNPTPSPKDVV